MTTKQRSRTIKTQAGRVSLAGVKELQEQAIAAFGTDARPAKANHAVPAATRKALEEILGRVLTRQFNPLLDIAQHLHMNRAFTGWTLQEAMNGLIGLLVDHLGDLPKHPSKASDVSARVRAVKRIGDNIKQLTHALMSDDRIEAPEAAGAGIIGMLDKIGAEIVAIAALYGVDDEYPVAHADWASADNIGLPIE